MISRSRLYNRALTIKIKADELYEAIRLYSSDPALFNEVVVLCAIAAKVTDALNEQPA